MTIGPLMIDLAGTEISPQERAWLEHSAVGGVILFTRNYTDKSQFKDLIAEIHVIKAPRLLVAIDQEGGRVQRLREGFTAFPPLRNLGHAFDQDAATAVHLSHLFAQQLACELREIGIDLSFAPVVDIDYGLSVVIGDRAFHSDIDALSRLAISFQSGLREGGMESVAKHFPGHGGVQADTHTKVSIDTRLEAEIWNADIVPFQRLIANELAGVMSSHVIYQAVDSKPASLSPIWLKKILRQQLSFQGVIFSDDLSMQGALAQGSIEFRLEQALEAGSDMLLICNRPQDVPAALDYLNDYNMPASQLRLARYHGRTAKPLTVEARLILDTWIDDLGKNESLSLNLEP